MIENTRQLRKALRKLTDMKGLDHISILYKGNTFIPYAFENQVRALQVLVYNKSVSADDVKIVEWYYTEQGLVRHEIRILPNGCLEEPFATPFFSKNDELSFAIKF